MDLKDTLFRLTAAVGTSGREEDAAATAANMLKKYCRDVHFDAAGNVIGSFGGEGEHILIEAHIDQIGLIVTAVEDGGFIKASKCGGIDLRTLAAQEVTVWGSERVSGIVVSTPPHLSGGEDKTDFSENILIDTGFNSDELHKKISVGYRVTVNSNQTALMNGIIATPALDDRAGVAAILYALDMTYGKKIKNKVTVAFTSQEEVGRRGAKTVAFECGVQKSISVDVSFALTPDSSREECGELGKGVMIGVSPVLSKHMSDRLISLCKKKNIPYQLEIMSGDTGTNADALSVTGGGICSSLISIPIRYMHTGVETADITDIENTARLIAAYLERGYK